MLEHLLTWLDTHASLLVLIGVLSFALLILSLLASPWLLAQLPANYFSEPPKIQRKSALQRLLALVRTVLGLLLALVGIVLMVTPGPGLVCLVLGLTLCDFPGKHTVLVKLIRQPNVLPTLNWLRRKASKQPFSAPAYIPGE